MVILLVDDDIDEYDIFCEALKAVKRPIDCLHALDGDDALRKLKALTRPPDHIFLDSNMPVMDGRRCLAIMKADPRLRHIPVYIYTTSSAPAEIETYKRLGADDFIVKPGSFSGLVDILRVRLS